MTADLSNALSGQNVRLNISHLLPFIEGFDIPEVSFPVTLYYGPRVDLSGLS